MTEITSSDTRPKVQVDQTRGSFVRERQIFAVALAVVALLMLRDVVEYWRVPLAALSLQGNDEIMRLLSVRDWLSGAQGWYEMHNARIVPPEGVSLHWSRLIDLGLAAIIVPLSWVMPMERAEGLAAILWPTFLQMLFVAVSVAGVWRLFGGLAASLTALAVMLWQTTGGSYFGPLKLDHHGAQILLLACMIFALAAVRNPLRAGVLAGLAAGLSLAIGLEGLPVVGLAGLFLLAAAEFGAPDRRRRLLSFGVALPLASAAFFALQTDPGLWAAEQCDALSIPFLALTAIGTGLALTQAALHRLPPSKRRLALGLAIGVAAGLTYLALQPCLSGPYGNLPEDVRALIDQTIFEAMPALFLARHGVGVIYVSFLPALGAVLATAWLIWRQSASMSAEQRRALALMLSVAALGVAFAFVQIRLLVLAAPVIPALIGICLAQALTALRAAPRNPASFLGLLAVIGVTALPPPIYFAAMALQPDSGVEVSQPVARACRTPSNIAALAELPPATFLTFHDLGPPMLLLTEHRVLSAPYHRSAAALSNFFLAFTVDETRLWQEISRYDAEYVILCRDTELAQAAPFLSELAAGEGLSGLTPVAGFAPGITLLRVTR